MNAVSNTAPPRPGRCICSWSRWADAHGLSYYSDASLTARLPLDRRPLHHARDALIGAGLIAFEHPLYQVLSLDNEAPATPAERTGAHPTTPQ